MSGFTDSIRERRAREIRFGDGWEEEDEAEATTETRVSSLGLLVGQRLLTLDEQFIAVEKLLEGRLSPEYLSWNGRTR